MESLANFRFLVIPSYLQRIRGGATHFDCTPAGDDACFSLETAPRRRHADWMQHLIELHGLVQLDDGNVVVVVAGIVLGMRDYLRDLAINFLQMRHLAIVLQQTHRNTLLAEAIDTVRGSQQELIVQQRAGAVETSAIE